MHKNFRLCLKSNDSFSPALWWAASRNLCWVIQHWGTQGAESGFKDWALGARLVNFILTELNSSQPRKVCFYKERISSETIKNYIFDTLFCNLNEKNQEKRSNNVQLLNDYWRLLKIFHLYYFSSNLFLFLLLSGSSPRSMEHTPLESEHRFLLWALGSKMKYGWKFPSELTLQCQENKTSMKNSF